MGISENESCLISLEMPSDFNFLEIEEDKDKSISSSVGSIINS